MNEQAPKIENVQVVNTIMPGLWDCHGHFLGINSLDIRNEIAFTDPMVLGMRSIDDAKRALFAGITSVREAGGFGIYLKKVIAEGIHPGPLAPKSGLLKEDHDADLIVVKSNPLEDITILQDNSNFTHIIKSGNTTLERKVHEISK